MDRQQGEWNKIISILTLKKGCFQVIFLVSALMICVTIGIVAGDTDEKSPAVPSIMVVDAKGLIDISQIGEIPIGQIPDERITVTAMFANNGNQVVSGLRIRSFLVKEGREDTIGLQLGSDFSDEDLKPGELKTYKNSYVISKKLKPGNYRIMIRVDPDAAEKGMNTDSIEYVSPQIIKVGAYAEASGAVPVYSPNKIETPGNYLLMRDIDGGTLDSIFKITTSGITFDGGGHTIRGTSTGYTKGIYVDGGTFLNNIIIKNCKFEGSDFGLYLYRVDGVTIQNCEFKKCTNIGLRFDQSRGCSIVDNTFEENALGLGLFQSSANKVTNNYFKNTFNAVVNEGYKNIWNTDLYPGENIIGGPTMAGNAWFDLNGGGYSVITPDHDHDGIADAPYSINGENIDYHPLSLVETGQDVPPVSPPGNETPVVSEPEKIMEENIASTGFNNATTVKPDINVTIEPIQAPVPVNASSSSLSADSADLTGVSIDTADSVCLSGELLVNATIENIGNLEAKSFSVHYYLSRSTGITISDTDVGSHQIDSLKPQENLTYSDTIRIPGGAGLGQYALGIIIDPSHNIYEMNKQNNVKVLNHRIQVQDCS
jgi:parallel beta-helix repeat protein